MLFILNSSRISLIIMKDKKNKFRRLLIAAVGIIILICLFITPLSRLIKFRGEKALRDKIFRGIAWFKFNRKSALKEWEEKIFKGRVLYSVIVDKTNGYLDAYSKNSASGILYWLRFDPVKKPMVSWKWKVIKFPERKAGSYEESGWLEKDDYAARFYIIFPKFPFYRVRCLEYIWDKDLPLDTVLTNPNFKNLKIIVAESGEKNLGNWVYVERNIYEDFKKIFGYTPSNVGAIAIMTDSENTATTAQAQYADIKVGYEK